MNWDDRADRFEEKPVRTAISGSIRTGVVVAVVITVIAVIGVGMWALKVATSDIKGAGDAEIIKNEARNRIRAQEGFLDKFNAIIAADENLTLTAEQLKATPSSVKLQTELTGQKMICNDLVARYNADTRKFTMEEFRDAELPFQIDKSLPTTDCKEISK